jgi:hypothetical protein
VQTKSHALTETQGAFFFFKICNNTKFQDPILSDTSVASTSEIKCTVKCVQNNLLFFASKQFAMLYRTLLDILWHQHIISPQQHRRIKTVNSVLEHARLAV